MKTTFKAIPKLIIIAAIMGSAGTALADNSNPTTLVPTPEQTVGPFYPGYKAFDKADDNMSNTLYRIISFPVTEVHSIASSGAKGQLLRIKGEIVDINGQNVPGAEVQIWQTDGDLGRYLIEKTDKPLDPNFDYIGKTMTDFKGQWSIATLRPKEYEADTNWIRPDHLHVRVFIAGKLKLTTQLYFADDQELIDKDLILQALTPEQRKSLIMELVNDGVKNESSAYIKLVLK